MKKEYTDGFFNVSKKYGFLPTQIVKGIPHRDQDPARQVRAFLARLDHCCRLLLIVKKTSSLHIDLVLQGRSGRTVHAQQPLLVEA